MTAAEGVQVPATGRPAVLRAAVPRAAVLRPAVLGPAVLRPVLAALEWPTVDDHAAGVPAAAARWFAILVGAVVVARTADSLSALAWGVPMAVVACLWAVSGRHPQPPAGGLLAGLLIADVALAALAASQTGGWHSGWVISLVGEAALAARFLPSRSAGPLAAAVVVGLFGADLVSRGSLVSHVNSTSDLDVLMVIATLSVSYAVWLARFADADRVRLARAHHRLTATNDLLVSLEEVLLRGEDFTDPQQAARAVARLCRDQLRADVTVVASTTTSGASWRVLLAEGVVTGPAGEGLDVLGRLGSDPAGSLPAVIRTDRIPGLLGDDSRSGVCVPLLLKGRLVGAVVIEASRREAWNERHFERMAHMSRWAALLIDNACRFHALWVVGSAEQRSRVARGLHDNLGQHLAALGLQLDALARTSPDPAAARIRELRSEVTGMVADLRYTMRDLVCDVSAEKSLGEALEQLLQGLTGRSKTQFSLDVRADRRLPLAEEHQILQIARSLAGAGLRSKAESVDIEWSTDAEVGRLRVRYRSARAEQVPGGACEAESAILEALAEVQVRGWAVGATVDYWPAPDGSSEVACVVGSWR